MHKIDPRLLRRFVKDEAVAVEQIFDVFRRLGLGRRTRLRIEPQVNRRSDQQAEEHDRQHRAFCLHGHGFVSPLNVCPSIRHSLC